MVDENLRKPLILIRCLTYDIASGTNFLDLKSSEPMSIEDFRNHENQHIIMQSGLVDKQINDDIKKILEQGCKLS